ncbi:MFS transporter [Paenibacillus sp. P96]|uniref:MFS transporter n=1 Tax=Paenibacillus zeirhizosphaerae TaxID=2987519 RepID=A0ABT9FQ77_9BACL|nr:MFS transporter [Paenibacillus sp. P96]MDP4096868.1 MFS transporter [Paenibacillus sp. P96]
MEENRKRAAERLLSPLFIALWVLVFLVEFLKGSLLVSILPVYMGDTLGLSAGVIGLAFSLQYLGDNLFRVPAGWLAERLGYRGTMAAALVVTIAAVLMMSFFSSSFWLVLACLLLGIGTSPLWPCAMTGITENSGPSNSNGTAMGTLEIAVLGGTGLGPVVMNFVTASTGHQYGVVFMVLTSCAILTLLVALLLPGRKLVKEATTIQGKAAERKRASLTFTDRMQQITSNMKSSLHFIKTNLRVNPLIYPALFLQSFVLGLLSPVLTLYARSDLGISPNLYSVLLIAGGGVTVLALIPLGKLVDRFGPRYFLHVGFALAGLTLVTFAAITTIPMIFLAVGVVGLSYALILPAWNTFLAGLIPEGERGTVWGFFLTLQGSGLVVGPILSGMLWDHIGHTAPFVTSGVVMLLLFVCHMLLERRPYRSKSTA